jgi:hypothetical protein
MATRPATVSSRAGSAATALQGSSGNVSQSCPNMTLVIGIFFDGTLNNEYNTAMGGSDTSYKNARSNVSLLKDLYKAGAAHDTRNSCGGYKTRYRRLYVEGIGTSKGKGDALFGKALGMGATGVEQRVYDTFVQIGRIVTEASPKSEPTEIIIDVFGFSRGAAAARYFINCIRQRSIRDTYLPKNRVIKFRFVGLFDTVAAIGIGTNSNNHMINVHLKMAQAKAIYHLTAQHEYRQNFRLNRNTPDGGATRALPGAHSDVGGGYRAAGDEATTRTWTEFHRTLPESDAKRAHFGRLNRQAPLANDDWVQEGWVNANDPPGTISFQLGQTTTLFSRLDRILGYQFSVTKRISRPWVRPGLARVALRIMYDQAKAAGVPFTAFPSTALYTLQRSEGEITTIGNKLIAGQGISDADLRYLLRNYIHISGNTSAIGMSPESNYKRVTYPNIASKAK